MRVRGAMFVGVVAVVLALLVGSPPATQAYVVGGPCDYAGDYTWDAVFYSTANTDGVEMDQYQLAPVTSWRTCTSAFGTGHMDELLSLQGTGSQIVQLGIARYISNGSMSWLFIYTPSDHSGGTVEDAGALFGEEPVAGRTYFMHILSRNVGAFWEWEYCLKDFNTGHEACWDTTYATWHSSSGSMWFGGETLGKNSTMGETSQSPTFRTYAMRRHSTSGAWGSYITNSYIDGHCYSSGFNLAIAHCQSISTNGFGGSYVWTH